MKNIWATASLAVIWLGSTAWGDEAPSAQRAAPIASASASLKDRWPSSDTPTRVIKEPGVPNFGKLNAAIWRSGQPTREGYANLADQGLKTVINLRKEFPQDKDRVPAGVQYVYIAMKNDYAPTDEQAKRLMEVVTNPANWPVLIHCTAGEGRTGTMAALIRHSLDGWEHSPIMAEVGIFWKDGGPQKMRMAACQKKYIQDWELTPVLLMRAPFAASN